LHHPCGEQGKLPLPKLFKLAERDKHMSEQKFFMQQLDAWTFQAIVAPLLRAAESGDVVDWNKTRDDVYKAVRTKVLESYRNGQTAGQKPAPSKERR
jgi:hypothetical protein